MRVGKCQRARLSTVFLGLLANDRFPTRPFSTQLRVIDREGEPWFIAKDLLLALDIGGGLSAGPSPYLKHLGEHEKGLVTVLTPRGGPQSVLAVNESGFYKLVLKSRKPEARKFQDWVTGTVLPAIRKDGGSAPKSLRGSTR